MNRNFKISAVVLLTVFSFSANPSFAQLTYNKKEGLKKQANISLNITNRDEEDHITFVNFGLASNFDKLNGFGFNIFTSINRYHAYGFQLSGFANISGGTANGMQIAGLSNVAAQTSKGLTIAGLVNASGKTMNGLQISGLSNVSGGFISGMSIGGLLNIAKTSTKGLQIAGIANLAGGSQDGVAIGGLMNVTGGFCSGVAISAILNVSAKENNGFQLTGLGNVSQNNSGLQTAFLNYTEKNTGVQLGVTNITSDTYRGWQIGLLNFSNRNTSHQVGMVNIKPQTRIQMIISGGNASKFNVGVRMKNRHIFTQFGLGTHYLGLDKPISLAASYRTGLTYELMPRLSLNGDIGYYHIESLENGDDNYPERMYALHPTVSLEYQLCRRFGIYAGGGYSWALAYKGAGLVNHKSTFEVGLILF